MGKFGSLPLLPLIKHCQAEGAGVSHDLDQGAPVGPPAATSPGGPQPSGPHPPEPGLRSPLRPQLRRGRVRGSTIDPRPDRDETVRTKVVLGLKAKALGIPKLPGIASLTLATRRIKKEEVLDYIRLAALDGDPNASKWLYVWDDLTPSQQLTASLDDVCAASGVSPVKLLKAVLGVAYDTNCDVANLVASVAHPSVVEASTRFAQKERGIEDRRLLFQHHGFTPTPKGTTINIGVSASAQAASSLSADQSVPSFLEDMTSLQAPHEATQKSLTDGSPLGALEAEFHTAQDLEGLTLDANQPKAGSYKGKSVVTPGTD